LVYVYISVLCKSILEFGAYVSVLMKYQNKVCSYACSYICTKIRDPHEHTLIDIPKSSNLMKMLMCILLDFGVYMSMLMRYQKKVYLKHVHICTKIQEAHS
jgi:hypothetical protein